MSSGRSPALAIRFPPHATAVTRDRLVALLADHQLLAIVEDDPASPRVWTAHFPTSEARDAAAAAVHAWPDGTGLVLEPADIEDEDWARRTQADLPAVRIGRVIVAPPWDMPAPEGASGPDAPIVVEIEPSRGFGTGHHQSTRLCIVLLQVQDLTRRTVLDVGTGSGVLAIVAARLGAAFVSAIDVDPEAVENARENIDRNGVSPRVEAHVGELGDGTFTRADVVTANLTGTLLARHATSLTALVRPGGTLIAAGFTVDEKPAVLEAFSERLALVETAEEDGWWAVALRDLPGG